MKRKGDRYSTHTSLIVASAKRLLPVGLRSCLPSDQSIIEVAKNSFSQVGGKYADGSTLDDVEDAFTEVGLCLL